MNNSCINFTNVNKRYTISDNGSYASLRDDIANILNFKKKKKTHLEAIKTMSFTINKGEIVAFIGHNGAGKSTLLKLISKITQPTEGKIKVNGRVATLMELGAGFHHELSGRENIAFFAAILGMNKEEMIEAAPKIIEFSELGDFIDIPVKKYSSGMQLRLGFSIAVHVNPDIFLLDEIFAVGDKQFTQKCFKKIDELIAKNITFILVSHNEEIIKKIATRALLFDHGQLVFDGDVNEAYNRYNSTIKIETKL